MACSPACAQASRADGGTNPARVKPHSLIRLSTAGSLGGLFQGMMGKKFVAATAACREPNPITIRSPVTTEAVDFIPRNYHPGSKATKLSAVDKRSRLFHGSSGFFPNDDAASAW